MTGTDPGWSRRRVLGFLMAGLGSVLAHACEVEQQLRGQEQASPAPAPSPNSRRPTPSPGTPLADHGRLLARPGPPATDAPPGLHPLGLAPERDGLLYVPPSYQPGRPAPLVLMLHGAGGNAHGGLAPFQGLADTAGLILLAPDSRRQTWDVILGGYGPDVAFIDQALAQTFERYAVDPGTIAIEGFSDGASYALSLGLTNGDLFTHIIAFSPGFVQPRNPRGSPRLFVSHGTQDEVLPIDDTSRRIVPALEHAGYDVRYREFDGPHTVPPEVAQDSVDWFLVGRS